MLKWEQIEFSFLVFEIYVFLMGRESIFLEVLASVCVGVWGGGKGKNVAAVMMLYHCKVGVYN